MLFEKEEEKRTLKEKSVKDHVIHALRHTYEYPKSIVHSVASTAKTQLIHAANAMEDSIQQLTSTTGKFTFPIPDSFIPPSSWMLLQDRRRDPNNNNEKYTVIHRSYFTLFHYTLFLIAPCR